MALRQWLVNRLTRGEPLPVPAGGGGKNFLISLNLNNLDLTPIKTTEEQLDNYVGWIYAAVTRIGSDCRANERGLWKKMGKKRTDWELLEKVPLWMTRPNLNQTMGQFIEARNIYKDTTGAAWWHLITANPENPMAKIIGMELINPAWVEDTPIYNATKTAVEAYWVQVPGSLRKPIKAYDIIKDFYFNPKDPTKPMSPIEGFALTHMFDTYTRAYGMKMIRDGAAITQAVVSDQDLTKEQADTLESRYMKKGRTPGSIVVFGKGAQIITPGIPMKDMDFARIWKPNREQILAVYSMPPAVLGITDGAGDTNQKVVAQQYGANCLLNRLKTFDEIMNEYVIPRSELANGNVIYESLSPVREDRDFILKKAMAKFESGGSMINDMLNELGDEEIGPDGDVYFIPSTVTVVKKPIEANVKPTGDVVDIKPEKEDPLTKIAEAAMRVSEDKKSREIKRLRRVAAEARFLQVQETQEHELKNQSRRLFNKEQDDVLDSLKKNVRLVDGKYEMITLALVQIPHANRDWLDEAMKNTVDEWHEIIKAAWVKGMRTGVNLLQEEVAGAFSFKIFEERARRFAQTVAGEKVTGIKASTLSDLRRVIANAIEKGKSVDEIAKEVSRLYDGYKGARAQTIARTEVANSIGWGKYENAKETERKLGMKIVRTWVATMDERTRPEHADADGQERGVNEFYDVGGVAMQHPGDTSAPAELVINCRCTETYLDVSE